MPNDKRITLKMLGVTMEDGARTGRAFAAKVSHLVLTYNCMD